MGDLDDLDNLFEDYESISRPEGNANASGDETPVVKENGEEKAPERVEPPVRRIVRNPRLKFNPDRLCGERGIPVLTKHFKNVKFKGKGHEKEDLDKLLSTLNHWCHRLFPSMKFEDCLQQIEKLGKKRPVQTCLHKIRHDMPILSNDFIGDEVEREGGDDNESERLGDVEANPEDAFDRLFNQEHDLSAANFTSTPVRQQATGNTLGKSFGSTLTEEQKKRIEYNRSLAIERRKSKLSSMQTAKEINLSSPSSSNFIDLDPNKDNQNVVDKTTATTNNSEKDLENPAEFSDSFSIGNPEVNFNNCEKDDELDMDELMDFVEDENSNEKTENMLISRNDNVKETFETNLCETNSKEPLSNQFDEMSKSILANSDQLENMKDIGMSETEE